jgi:5-methylcytosine-specific restriction endonuclease McrA
MTLERKHQNLELARARDRDNHRRYRRNDPGKVRAANRRCWERNSAKYKAAHDAWMDALLFSEQDGKCPYCYDDLNKTGFQIDHYIPIILGGANEDWNAQLLCPSCNKSKGGKHPHEFEAALWNKL